MRGNAATPGANSRLDELQAEVLVRKLAHLDEWNDRRRQLAAYYREQLEAAPVTLPTEAPERLHAWHLFVVLVDDRTRFRAGLGARAVDTAVHYPLPIHHQAAYSRLGGRVPLAIAERACERVVSLPLYPELTDEEARYVVDAVRAS
jgi:dTDP-4-amino-4,6-dideoxygalactose transaminase